MATSGRHPYIVDTPQHPVDATPRRLDTLRSHGRRVPRSYAGKLWLAEFEEFHHVT